MTWYPRVLDRRRFLRTGTVAGLGLAALPALGAADKPADPFGGFKLGAQSYTFRQFNTEQTLQRLKELGLHYVEFYQKHAPLESSPEQIRALLKLCREYAVAPRAWGVHRFTRDDAKNRAVFEFGKALGLKMFSADPDPDSFDSLDKMCAEYQIAIGIHPHGPQGRNRLHRWYSAEVIMKAVKDHHPLIGACLDTGHLIRAAQLGKKLDPAAEIRVMGKRNVGVHLKDHDNQKHTDVVFGKGVMDLGGILQALRDVKFDGMLSIEYEAHPDHPLPDVRECVAVFRQTVKG
jgi:sugar phosphate isomerase/epimerase